jgi:formylglycine-generating enzyme required for sulfatase activity
MKKNTASNALAIALTLWFCCQHVDYATGEVSAEEQTSVNIPVYGIASGEWRGTVGGPQQAVNGAGLRGDRHGPRIGDNWMQAGTGGDNTAWFVFDLAGRCDLARLVFWNYFERGGGAQQNNTLPNRGIASADIYIATAGGKAHIPENGSGAFDFKAAGWTLFKPGMVFRRAPVARSEKDTAGPTDIIDLSGLRRVTHIALADIKHFGADAYGNYVGFSEARINPLPGTYVMDAVHPRIKALTGELFTRPMASLRMALKDQIATFGERYPRGTHWLEELDALEAKINQTAQTDRLLIPDVSRSLQKELESLKREALLANPLLDFEQLLLVRRREGKGNMWAELGLPINYTGNCALPRTGYDNEIALLDSFRSGGTITTLYKPSKPVFVGDVDLHWDAEKILFSSIGSEERWHLFEVGLDGKGLRQVTPGGQTDYDNYDGCYLPNGGIVFGSTASMAGVPCHYGKTRVANLYLMNPDGTGIRQLGFDQDHNWCPQVLHDGRILYLRWEYADLPHSNSRILFTMNPDGTNQREHYGSNSYWPNGIFYARPIPGESSKVAGIVTGHHGVHRMGELVIFDPALGRREADGVVQRIPGYGKKVEPIVADRLVDASWPKFLHPYPLSSKYFLVSAKPTPKSRWGIYLVDVFDNMVLLAEQPGSVLFEPVPICKTPCPPVIVDQVDLTRKDAVVNLANIYEGPGLEGVPPGTVKNLRVFTYHYTYPGFGGLLGLVGADGPWDPRRILGTVPVEEDGSALFRVPANTPISIQPLDAEGKAVQVMRSWFTAMPGEILSCVGCHESQNTAVASTQTVALTKSPTEITPWRGPARGFHFAREVQPVLDKYCLGCHDGPTQPDLRGLEPEEDFVLSCPGNGTGRVRGRRFSRSYLALHPLVRRPGIESDIHLLTPMEFHANSTELVQLLRKGHHGVTLDDEAWDRLITWIDLNTPFYGTWSEIMGKEAVQTKCETRKRLQERYAGVSINPEEIDVLPQPAARVEPERVLETDRNVTAKGWPFNADEAAKRQTAGDVQISRTVDLGGGVKMHLRLVPAGAFVMGDADGRPDEAPLTRVRIKQPFWMGAFEVSNAQYAQFDPRHDSHVESKLHYQFGIHGYPLDEPDQPVVRVSWKHAMAFCEWLSERTGQPFTLPTEAQWEWACRSGTATPFFHGDLDADFSKHANVADATLSRLASNPYTLLSPMRKPTKFDDYVPKDSRFNDGSLVSVEVGTYAPNVWGLHDMHGNVAEWTRSVYKTYPYDPEDGRDAFTEQGRKVVRGGSWRDRPTRCRSAFRLDYPAWQRVYNVGFRVVCPADPTEVAARVKSRTSTPHGSGIGKKAFIKERR